MLSDGIVGMKTIPIGNGAGTVAQVSIAPNINFYILADSSPSMGIPATTAGVNEMYQVTYCAYNLAIATATAQAAGSTKPAAVSGCPDDGDSVLSGWPLVYGF